MALHTCSKRTSFFLFGENKILFYYFLSLYGFLSSTCFSVCFLFCFVLDHTNFWTLKKTLFDFIQYLLHDSVVFFFWGGAPCLDPKKPCLILFVLFLLFWTENLYDFLSSFLLNVSVIFALYCFVLDPVDFHCLDKNYDLQVLLSYNNTTCMTVLTKYLLFFLEFFYLGCECSL